MKNGTYKGVVRGGTVILEEGAGLPDGAEVVVTPAPGSVLAILTALRTAPKVSSEAVDELNRMIEEGKRPVSYANPLRKKRKKKEA